MKISTVIHNLLSSALLFLFLQSIAAATFQQPPETEDTPITAAEIAAAQQFGQTLSIAEWLGPMAPVALSPFFGITCLSGLSLFGGGWISKGNPLIGAASPLHNPAVFWTFLAMTMVTSIPRLTKVSKPFAQAIDQLEAWSGIVTMILIRVLLSSQSDVADTVAHLGIVSITVDGLIMFTAALNIFIINAVKFFFEVLIWLTPIPFIDALFEISNKAVCAGLMFVYALSPIAAMSINLILFGLALVIFGWVHRREIFFRTILFDAVRALLSPRAPCSTLVVFPATAVGPIKARSRCLLSYGADGWTLTFEPWFRKSISIVFPQQSCPIIQLGLVTNLMTMNTPSVQLTFSRLYNHALADLATRMNATLAEKQSDMSTRQKEFA